MKRLPIADPGTPDPRSATRYLMWVARQQVGTMVAGVAFGVAWMVAQALVPATVGRAVDAITARDPGALGRWTAALAALGLVQAAAGVMRHRFALTNFLAAGYRTVQVTARQAVRLGAALPKRVATGEVVSIGTSDISHIGNALDITARGAGAVVAIVVVAAILLTANVRLGLEIGRAHV